MYYVEKMDPQPLAVDQTRKYCKQAYQKVIPSPALLYLPGLQQELFVRLTG
jgi:hypothetical protein